MTKSEVGQHQSDQTIDGPDMETPVKKCDLHRLFGGIDCLRCAQWWFGKMQHRFGNTEEQQCNAVAGREQHGEPDREGILRFGVVRAEANIAKA